MTTKQVPHSPGQTGLPASDLVALPPGPGKSQTPKRSSSARDFATVIDQAAANGTGQPAHVRTTKSSSRGRRGDATETPVRERTSTSARETQSKARHARTGESAGDDAATESRHPLSSKSETQADVPSEQVQNGTESGRTLARAKTGKDTTSTAELEASTDDAAASGLEVEAPAKETEASAEKSAASNIIQFPGTTNAVIIPFPLAEAQAAPAATRATLPAAVNLTVRTAKAPSSATATNVTNIPTAQASVDGTTSSEPASLDTVPSQGGIDVSALGLKPVSGNETAPIEPVTGEAASTKSAPRATNANEPSGANILSVAFNAAQASELRAGVSTSGTSGQTQLPGDGPEAEETARQPLDTPVSASSAKIVLLRTDAAKPAPDAAGNGVTPPPPAATGPAGISGARQEDRMESMTASKHAAATTTAGAESAFEAPAEFAIGNRTGMPGTSDLSDRTKVATDWQSGRPVSSSDQPVLETQDHEPADAATSVERISSLVLREAALVKKYSSDSMAVVLRPDAETELFVHLTQRNGQVEATVRCERGDAQHLGALWPQLQESLAQQKVRLAPLEDSAGSRGNTNFQPPSGSLTSGGGERGTREDARPSQQQSMDEWPATPAPATATPHVRGGRGTRGRRISTSRPGWETWA